MKRLRLKKWAKWTCTLAAGLSAGLAVFSVFCWAKLSMVSSDQTRVRSFWVGDGVLVVSRYTVGDPDYRDPAPGIELNLFPVAQSTGWRWGLGFGYDDGWHAGVMNRAIMSGNGHSFGVNFVYPILLAAIPAALLWYADRRRFGPHACGTCDYDRRGLAPDTKCPECATAPTPATK